MILIISASLDTNNGQQVKKAQPPNGLKGHPAPLPAFLLNVPQHWARFPKSVPPPPKVGVRRTSGGIILTWTLDLFSPAKHAEVKDYQLYGYKGAAEGPSSNNWTSLGHVKALKLPMAVTLTQFQHGQKYFFCVRARDSFGRYGPFSTPSTW